MESKEQLISRELVLKRLTKLGTRTHDTKEANAIGQCMREVEKAPFITLIRETGFWAHKNDDYNDWLECSECGYGSEGEVKMNCETPYCPHCGALMTETK